MQVALAILLACIKLPLRALFCLFSGRFTQHSLFLKSVCRLEATTPLTLFEQWMVFIFSTIIAYDVLIATKVPDDQYDIGVKSQCQMNIKSVYGLYCKLLLQSWYLTQWLSMHGFRPSLWPGSHMSRSNILKIYPVVCDLNCSIIFIEGVYIYAPNFKKVEGKYCFGLVSPSVRPSDTNLK